MATVLCMMDVGGGNSIQIDIYSIRHRCVVLQLNGPSWKIPSKGEEIEGPFRLMNGEVITFRGTVVSVEHKFEDLPVGSDRTWLQKVTVNIR